jgi:hypothetical protein
VADADSPAFDSGSRSRSMERAATKVTAKIVKSVGSLNGADPYRWMR